jgi:hypothetical protein
MHVFKALGSDPPDHLKLLCTIDDLHIGSDLSFLFRRVARAGVDKDSMRWDSV